jgi:hypothetical protein
VTKQTKLPSPRLQLRWAPSTRKAGFNWECHYELVIPLDKYDIRAEQEGPRGGKRPPLKEMVIPMKGPSLRESQGVPCTDQFSGQRYYDAPDRDGAHAMWDAKLIGNPPIFVIAPDGVAFAGPSDDAAAAIGESDE